MKTFFLFSSFVLLLVNNSFTQTLDWAKMLEAEQPLYPDDLKIDEHGNIFTLGHFYDTVDFDLGTGVYELVADARNTFVQKLDSAGNFVWAIGLRGDDLQLPNEMTIDASGNVYVIGGFEGTVDFDPGLGVYNLTSNGGRDAFILKLDALGNFVWARKIGGTSKDEGHFINVDSVGNVYVIGAFSSNNVDFDSGPGNSGLSASGGSFFIQKLDAFGNFVWVGQIGGNIAPFDMTIGDMEVDGAGFLHIVGTFSRKVDVDPSFSPHYLTAVGANLGYNQPPGRSDGFVLKLNQDGSLLWSRQLGAYGKDGYRQLSLDELGNLYTWGVYKDTVDFDFGLGQDLETTFGYGSRNFIQKISKFGEHLWVKPFEVASYSSRMLKDFKKAADGNFYLSGCFEGGMDVDPSSQVQHLSSNGFYDGFVLVLDSLCNYLWSESIGGGDSDCTQGVGVDGSRNMYVVGHYYGHIDYDPGPSQLIIDNTYTVPWADIVIRKFNQWHSNTGVDACASKNLELIRIYPNPTQGEVSVDLGEEMDVTIELMDLSGKLLYKKAYWGTSMPTIRITDNAGIYILGVKTKHDATYFKVQKL